MFFVMSKGGKMIKQIKNFAEKQFSEAMKQTAIKVAKNMD